MFRQAVRGVVVAVVVAVVADATGRGQPPGGTDLIYYRKTKDASPTSVKGELKMSATGFQIVTDKAAIPVSFDDIVSVVPSGDLPGVDAKDVNAARAAEEKREWAKALDVYQSMRKNAKSPPERTRRFLEFKVATTTARVADETAVDAGWEEKAKEAETRLSEFLVAYTTGWEVWPVAKTAARIQLELRRYADAARTWAKMARNAAVPAALRQEAAVQEIDALIRERQWPTASARIDEALKAAGAGAVKDRLALCRLAVKAADGPDPLAAVKQLEDEVAKAKDPVTRAIGHALIGELYLHANKPREAMWALLWVEVVYNQDRDEVAKALMRLAEAFASQGDEERAQSYRDKLRQYREQL